MVQGWEMFVYYKQILLFTWFVLLNTDITCAWPGMNWAAKDNCCYEKTLPANGGNLLALPLRAQWIVCASTFFLSLLSVINDYCDLPGIQCWCVVLCYSHNSRWETEQSKLELYPSPVSQTTVKPKTLLLEHNSKRFQKFKSISTDRNDQ